ncbi:MAG: hypothetical protein JSR91_04530 [Proteobacteria bacterium]|nr:hypothetical protein [Pseudomonadota bacterium]
MAKRKRDTIEVRSRLRMFFSLDIVGSTEFKQTKPGAASTEADSWVEPFLSFYQIAVQQMAAQWTTVRDDIAAVAPGDASGRFEFGHGPAFWKGVGDEVLFTKIVRSPLDAMAALHALLGLMEEQRRQFAAKPQWQRLNVKGTAWLAGFPINNAEVILPVKDGRPVAGALDDPVAENYRLLALRDRAPAATRALFHADYIGPSVDLGFRLREFADPRRLVISADLAWLICHAHRGCHESECARCAYLRMPEIGYEGRLALRGILGGEPYPLMWIESDPANPLNNAEDRLLRHLPGGARRRPLLPLWDFCNAFLNGDSPLRMRPYIPGCHVAGMGEMSDEHRRRLDAIRKLVNGPAEQLGSLARTDRESGPIPLAAQDFARGVLSDIESRPPGGRRRQRRTRRTVND